MPSRKRPRDPNQLGKLVVDLATGAAKDTPPETPHQANSRKGGEVGGKSRAEKLSPAQRSEIARKAAKARWAKNQ